LGNGAAVEEIGFEQLATGRGVGYNPLASSLGGLCSDSESAVGGVKVFGAQGAELFPAQPGVVGEPDHAPIADRLGPGGLEESLPLLIARDPREFLKAWQEPRLAPSAKGLSGGVAAAADGIGFSQAFLNQMVEEQADGG